MKLWQGWHNTDLGRFYFHYGPFGSTKKQMSILAQTCKKHVVKSTGKKAGNGKMEKWKMKSTGKKAGNGKMVPCLMQRYIKKRI